MFSYNEWKSIIDIIKESGKLKNFDDALHAPEWIISRHDVEFSVDRAYQLACFEKENDFNSTYFFQITNNTYNMFSKKNIDLLQKIVDMGNDVGLHFHMNGMTDIDQIRRRIELEIKVFGEMTGIEVNRFSVHRPNANVLAANIKMDGIINAYQDEFFSYIEDMEKEVPEIKYLSDARHRWNYGLIPDKKTLTENPKIQLLTHPYSWTSEGYDNLNNFKTLIWEKNEELKNSIDSECKHFAEVKDKLPVSV